jgi:8-oxo-dGTP diphosphatase
MKRLAAFDERYLYLRTNPTRDGRVFGNAYLTEQDETFRAGPLRLSATICVMSEFTAALKPHGTGQLDPFVAASVLLTDKSDNVLLVRSADNSWTIPNCMVSGDEAPHDCVARLVSQQLGLTAIAGQLLVISWTPAACHKDRAVVNFLFDGGAVHNEAALSVGGGALGVFRFFSWEQAESEVSATLAKWLPPARKGRKKGRTLYIAGAADI